MTARTPPSDDDRDHAHDGDHERDRDATGNRGGRIGGLRRRGGPFLGGAVAIRGRMGEPPLAGRRRRGSRRPAPVGAGSGAADGSVEVTRPS